MNGLLISIAYGSKHHISYTISQIETEGLFQTFTQQQFEFRIPQSTC